MRNGSCSLRPITTGYIPLPSTALYEIDEKRTEVLAGDHTDLSESGQCRGISEPSKACNQGQLKTGKTGCEGEYAAVNARRQSLPG